MIDPKFWRGKRVFITGHTGFKGSWLSLWLQSMGSQVKGFSLIPPTQPSLFEVANIAAGMKSIIGDIRDIDHLKRELQNEQPEIVFHLAAQPLVRQSYIDPVETYSTNVIGLVNLLEAVRITKSVRICVNITSDKCYENKEWSFGYRENDAMGGFDPYSSSKGCAELVTSAYRRSFFQNSLGPLSMRLASARAGNVIGGGDWAADRLIPDILRAFSRGECVEIRNPSAVRPWQHVLEPLSGYLVLAQRMAEGNGENFAEGWNFGPSVNDTRDVKWIVEHMTKLWGGNAAWRHALDVGPHEAHSLSLDCLKTARELNWQPAWGLLIALEKIIDWHQAFLSGADMHELTLEQIKEYTQATNLRGSV